MLFSIIIPVYNTEKYLNACLQSVTGQTSRNYEIILVDDGSEDKSGQICDDFQKEHADICRVVHKKNQGQLSSRIAGLKEATGEYAVFVDSDDLIREDMLALLEKALEKYSRPDVIFFQVDRTDADGQPLDTWIKMPFAQGMVDKNKVIETTLSSPRYNTLCNKACRRILFDTRTDYSEFYSIRNGEDLLQFLPVLKAAESFANIPESFYYYRTNLSSISHKYRPTQYKNLNVVRPLLYKTLKDSGIMTEKMERIFYDTYLVSIAASVYRIVLNEKEDRNSILNEILSYPPVKKAGEYLKEANISKKQKIILKYFYHRKFGIISCLCALNSRI